MPKSFRRARALSALLAATLAVVVVSSPVAAAAPMQVTIVSHMTFPGDGQPNFGDFQASGAAVGGGLICPAGTVNDLDYVFGGYQSGRGVQILVRKAFACNDGSGSFVVKIQVHVNADGSESFTWVVLGGTGDYAALSGSGSGATVDQHPTGNTNIYSGFLVH